jgi:DNA-binding SARP family transcriptional activator
MTIGERPSDIASDSDVARLTLLGRVELCGPKGAARLGNGRLRRLLVALAIDAPAEVGKEKLVQRIWGGSVRPANAESALRTYVSRLRHSLAGAGVPETSIVTTGRGYRLDTSGWIGDIDRFSSLLSQAESVEAKHGLRYLDEALDLWQGPPFGNLGDEHWAMAEAARLHELALSGRELRITYLSDLGRNEKPSLTPVGWRRKNHGGTGCSTA